MIGSIIGGIFGKKGAEAQADAAGEAVDLSREVWQQSRADYSPYREVGGNALAQLSALMGLGYPGSMAGGYVNGQWQATPTAPAAGGSTPQPQTVARTGGGTGFPTANQLGIDPATYERLLYEQRAQEREGGSTPLLSVLQQQYRAGTLGGQQAQQPAAPAAPATPANPLAAMTPAEAQDAAYAQFRTDPGYQFAYNEGLRALDASAAARGTLLSGGQAKALTRYGQGVADQQYGNYWNRLAGLAGVGQQATSGTAAVGQSYSNQAGNALMQQGNARASGYNALGQGIAGGFNNLLGAGAFAYGAGWL